jgi:hypothetical protein
LEGRWQKHGFYTPFFADAPDFVLAAQVALEHFRDTKKYQDLAEISLNGADDPSELLAEEIEEVRPDARFKAALAGLALYSEEETEIAEAGAAPNGGPSTPPGNSDVADSPPSVT